jgi:hypothetical protein
MTNPPIRQSIAQAQAMASQPTGDEVALVIRNASGPFGISGDAGGRQRVSQITTLFDGKTLGVDDTRSWDNRGSGTYTFQTNKAKLDVTSGQYYCTQSRHACPYFSGKSQGVEVTFDDMHTQAGVTKRVGYFSSNAVAPFDSNKDGFWLEDDGTTKRLIVSNNGTEKLNVALADWDGAAYVANYDWQNFTVILFDFIWLGGAVLRMWIKTGKHFTLLHQFDYAGTERDTFMQSPNQPVRYEIRGTSGAGTFRRICSTVFTEGSIEEEGDALTLITSAAISAGSVGTTYALRGIRKSATYRDIHTDIISFGGNVLSSGGQPDSGRFLLLLNPTLSSGLSWAANSKIEEGTATTQTVSAFGRILQCAEVTGAGTSQLFPNNALSILRMDMLNVADQVILAYQPFTATQTVHGHITIKED